MRKKIIIDSVLILCKYLQRIAIALEDIENKLPDRSCKDQRGVDKEGFFQSVREGLEELLNQDHSN